MDYSLLFVVAYNPKYVEKYKGKFEEGEHGEVKLNSKKIEKNPDSHILADRKGTKAYVE